VVERIGGKRADPERRRAAVERLGQLREAGELTSGHVRLAASGLGVRERTVWRWLRLAAANQPVAPAGLGSYQLSEADREAYARYRGNVAAVHRARAAVLASPDAPQVLAAGVPVPASLRDGWRGAPPAAIRTLQRAFRRELTAAEAAAWAEGEEGRRAAGVYLTRPAGHRNQTWEMDHKQLPVLVMPPRGAACCPWLTTVVDDATRVLAGWAIALTPHAGTVLTAVRMALVHDPARGPFGAIPARVRIDRGLEFAAEAVRDAFAALCVDPRRMPGFQPHRKGKVERIHRTIDQTLLCGLPGFTGGPRDAAGRLYGPLDDRFAARLRAAGDPVTPMPIEAFAALFAQWADWYNTQRAHDGLDGRTPLQAWQDDPGPLHRISAGKLRHLLLASEERVIGKDGIRFSNLAYIAPELAGRGGQRVQIRYMPHDDRSIEVYLGGTHLCTAYPATRLTPEQTQAYLENAARERKRLTAERRKASARARAELAPLTRDQTRAEESRVLPPAAGDELATRRGDALLRRKARSNLLGLTDPAQPPHADQES
jgi:putative transposase